jgi:hypothetical protein
VVKLATDADLSHVSLLESHPVRHGQQPWGLDPVVSLRQRDDQQDIFG